MPKVLFAITHAVFIIMLTILNMQLDPELRPGAVFWVVFAGFIVSTMVLYAFAGLSDPGYVNQQVYASAVETEYCESEMNPRKRV